MTTIRRVGTTAMVTATACLTWVGTTADGGTTITIGIMAHPMPSGAQDGLPERARRTAADTVEVAVVTVAAGIGKDAAGPTRSRGHVVPGEQPRGKGTMPKQAWDMAPGEL